MKKKPVKTEKKAKKNTYNFWDWKKEKVLEGVMTSRIFGVGKFRNSLYRIKEKKTGKVYSIWGSYALNLKLQYLPDGTGVKITDKGYKKVEGKKGYKAHNYIIATKKPIGEASKNVPGKNRGRLNTRTQKKPNAK